MTLRSTRQVIEPIGTAPSQLRITRQMHETLGRNTSQFHVTRQFIEVLVSYNIISRTIADSFTFNETIATLLDKTPKVYDTLSFVEQTPIEIPKTIVEQLIFTENIQRVKNGIISEELEFVDDNWFFNVIEDFKPTGDYLTLTESVEVECGNWRFVPDTLAFTETIEWQGPHYIDIAHYISFQEVFWNNNNWRQTVNDILTLSHHAGRPFTLTISDNLIFTDEGKRIVEAIDSLVFNELVLNGKGAPIWDELTFEQETSVKGSFIRVVTEDLHLGQSVAYYYITPCVDKQYRPFVGESDVIAQPSSPALNAPVAQGLPADTRFQLLYPAAGGATDSMTLRAPELDSRDRNAFNRINRETRGGRIVVFADPIWPKVTTIACTFVGLSKTEMLTLQEFVLSHIGEEIKVIDWEGRGWHGVVVKPNDPATCDGKDRWSIGFEFEGSRIENYDSGLSLVFTDTVTNVVLRRPVITDSLIFNQDAIYQVN